MTSLELSAADYRERYRRSSSDPGWWVVLLSCYDPEKVKAEWHTLGGHSLGNLRGFEFWHGPRYTYDPINGTWTVEETAS